MTEPTEVQEASRAEFEKWAKTEKLAIATDPDNEGTYWLFATELAYKAWQAGRAALSAENAQLREALQKIAERLEHTEDWSVPDYVCLHCVAERALAQSPQPSAPIDRAAVESPKEEV